MSSEALKVSPPKVFWSLLSIGIILASEIAAICSIAVLFLPSYFQNLARPPFLSFVGSWSPFLVASPLAGLLAGLPCWWLFIEHSKHVIIGRGVAVGVLSSLIAHPLVWTLVALFSPILGGAWGDTALEPNIQYVLVYSLMSLVYIGWLTATVGGVAGALLVQLRRALIDKQKGALS
ncbi:hypothetical protein EPA93_32335 [Ktedonosporobacter rubrisoli]|uniref:Uncharacterized protein n=1 Tax=Ktedonosporobacter rubrisoli TaxID=2509675 RepID=A0A4P6JXD5_KTERU|nr:hypothetical protein [Ktedonosporobacter rubrisoli]QBD80409.1 hypothetical protein EPA93_32335 [Ktedonosporobacter rubrisoli]